MGDWCVVPGPASRDLAVKISERLDADLFDIGYKLFPDGESKVTLLSEVRNQPVILVQSAYPPVDRHLFQALLLSHKLSEEGAEVHAVIPYLPYARQDREFLNGEIVSMRVIARLFRAVGMRRFTTVDIHSVEGLSNLSIPSYSASAVPLLAEYIQNNFKLADPIAASPDFGGSARVEAFSRILGIDHLSLEKSRDKVTDEVQVKPLDSSVSGRDAIIVDDIISTGGSIQKACIQLKKSGAKRVISACTHPVLVGDALEKMHKAGVDEVIGTNTIPQSVSKVDISSAIAEHFKTLG
jgi:ribose-phosphate pyrophosphokinase|tara:strand:+ start:879 stop:1766 length:888 start_codon:yes stop_codon:yes gene_type:complete